VLLDSGIWQPSPQDGPIGLDGKRQLVTAPDYLVLYRGFPRRGVRASNVLASGRRQTTPQDKSHEYGSGFFGTVFAMPRLFVDCDVGDNMVEDTEGDKLPDRAG
jgi:hypothetical protein